MKYYLNGIERQKIKNMFPRKIQEEAITEIMREINNSTDAEIKAVLDTMNKDYTVKDDDSIIRLFGDYLKD